VHVQLPLLRLKRLKDRDLNAVSKDAKMMAIKDAQNKHTMVMDVEFYSVRASSRTNWW